MQHFDKLLPEIPLVERADFYLELKKESAEVTAALVDERANAMRKTAMADKPKPSNEELKEVGRQRAVSNMAAEAHREKGRRGERAGETIGRLAGAAGGAALGKKYMGGRAGTIAGMAAGLAVGGKAGKEVGVERDIHKNAAALRLSLALHKLAEGEGAMTPPTADAPPSQMEPTNFIRAEQAGRAAQEQTESAFYREQLSQAKQQAATSMQQMAQTQSRLAQLEQEQATVGQSVQMAQQEAMTARDDSVAHAMEVAQARMGAQKMREAMLELASQDPATFGMPPVSPDEAAMNGQQAQTGVPGQPGEPPGNAGAPGPEAGMAPTPGPQGPAEQAPAPATAPGAAPPAGGPDMNANAESGSVTPASAKPTVHVKVAGHLGSILGAVGGGLYGAAQSARRPQQIPALQERLQQLEGQEPGALRAMRMARAKHDLVSAEHAMTSPGTAAIKDVAVNALLGAGVGASAQALAPKLKELASHLRKAAPAATAAATK